MDRCHLLAKVGTSSPITSLQACEDCQNMQALELLPIGTKVRLKPDVSPISHKMSGEVVEHLRYHVLVMWDDPSNSGDHPCEHATKLEKPTDIIWLYDIVK